MNGRANRDKLLSLRVSDSEYEILRRLFRKNGHRSASEFVRVALKKMMEADPVAPPPRSRLDEIETRMEALSANIARLTRGMDALLKQIPANFPSRETSSAIQMGGAYSDFPVQPAPQMAQSGGRLEAAVRDFDATLRQLAAARHSGPESAGNETAWNEMNAAVQRWKDQALENPNTAAQAAVGGSTE